MTVFSTNISKKLLVILNKKMANDNTKLLRNRDSVIKSDEFYTQYRDIDDELKHYIPQLKGKKIYCNCDSEQSNFVKWFKYHNFDVIHTSDDFRTHTDLIKECDIIVTNPPYSLAKEFIKLLVEYEKDFLIIASINVVAYKEIFPLIKDNTIRIGHNVVRWFLTPDNTLKEGDRSYWYTTLNVGAKPKLKLYGNTFNKNDYPTYDNYDGIDVARTKKIPVDYYGTMGVPLSFVQWYNPDEFEIVDINPHFLYTKQPIPKQLRINGKSVYSRILIKRKPNSILRETAYDGKD